MEEINNMIDMCDTVDCSQEIKDGLDLLAEILHPITQFVEQVGTDWCGCAEGFLHNDRRANEYAIYAFSEILNIIEDYMSNE